MQSTDDFFYYSCMYYSYVTFIVHMGHLAPLDLPKLPIFIASQFLLLSVNAVIFSVKELLVWYIPQPHHTRVLHADITPVHVLLKT
jgi:hypothetical protein